MRATRSRSRRPISSLRARSSGVLFFIVLLPQDTQDLERVRVDVGEPAEDVEHFVPRQGRFRCWLPTEHASIVPTLLSSLKMAAPDQSCRSDGARSAGRLLIDPDSSRSTTERSEQVVLAAVARLRLGEPLEPDAVELAGRGVAREAGEQLLEVAAALAEAALGRRRSPRRRGRRTGGRSSSGSGRGRAPRRSRPSCMYGVPSSVRSAKKRRRRASSSRKRLSTTISPRSSSASSRWWKRSARNISAGRVDVLGRAEEVRLGAREPELEVEVQTSRTP